MKFKTKDSLLTYMRDNSPSVGLVWVVSWDGFDEGVTKPTFSLDEVRYASIHTVEKLSQRD